MSIHTGILKVTGMTSVGQFPLRDEGILTDVCALPVPAGEVKLYRSPFFRDFWHLNVAMWTSNNALVPDPDKEDVIASKPLDWPMLHLGMRMNGWADTNIKYYLVSTLCLCNEVLAQMLMTQCPDPAWSPLDMVVLDFVHSCIRDGARVVHVSLPAQIQ